MRSQYLPDCSSVLIHDTRTGSRAQFLQPNKSNEPVLFHLAAASHNCEARVNDTYTSCNMCTFQQDKKHWILWSIEHKIAFRTPLKKTMVLLPAATETEQTKFWPLAHRCELNFGAARKSAGSPIASHFRFYLICFHCTRIRTQRLPVLQRSK